MDAILGRNKTRGLAKLEPAKESAGPLPGGLFEELGADEDLKPSLQFLHLVTSNSFEEKYILNKRAVLGAGMSGNVCRAKVRSSGVEVAVKELVTKDLSEHRHEQTLSEIRNQLSMDHPHICRMLEVYEEPTRLLVVMECIQGPSLYAHLSKSGYYSERYASGLMKQMCAAIRHCHVHGVCHRDLKPENFCLESDSSDARVKLIDFGLSERHRDGPMTHACGSLFYVAPEVFKQNYNEKCDIWSLGVITYAMLCGTLPFDGPDDRAVYRRIKSGQYTYPPALVPSAWARTFVAGMLELDVEKRFSGTQALEHHWIAGGDDGPPAALDSAVIQGMRNFEKSNALKKAVLSAVAPVATVAEVTRWADQFEALDEKGCGTVTVEELAKRLSELASMDEEEAQHLAAALAASGDSDPESGSEMVSYSAFLAACLSRHLTTTLTEQDCRELFDRIDTDRGGSISVEQLEASFGDLLDMEELGESMEGDQITFDEFRALLLGPLFISSLQGLRTLLNSVSGTGRMQWRVHTARAKFDSGDAIEAKRAENAAWRIWARNRNNAEAEAGEATPVPEPPARLEFQLSGGHFLAEQGPTSSTLPTITASPSPLKGAARDAAHSCAVEGDASPSSHAEWAVATLTAKAGDFQAARRENRCWRERAMWEARQDDSDKAATGA